jgi:hypothetical protein
MTKCLKHDLESLLLIKNKFIFFNQLQVCQKTIKKRPVIRNKSFNPLSFSF